MAEKTCFVIAPIGEQNSATRQRSDKIFKYVISPVFDKNWTVERADKISEPGIITNQIIERLISSDIVIADLSERNPNVFYELAIRHITRKPYVHLIAHDEDIPFDNAPVRAIKIDVRDLDSVDQAKAELSRQVKRSCESGAEIDSPISVSLSISDLKRSSDSESVALQSILSEMTLIKRQNFETNKVVSILLESITLRSQLNETIFDRNALNINSAATAASSASSASSNYLNREYNAVAEALKSASSGAHTSSKPKR
tara:strand:+ start:512 stop:1285 length:774 start_codon:yes stop_codon:yes gene_type:complete